MGKGCSEEVVIFPAQAFMLYREVLRASASATHAFCLGSAPSSRCYREVGLGKGVLPGFMTNIYIFTDPIRVKAPDLTQTLLYVTPPSARLLASTCKCAMKTLCRCEITTHWLHF